MIMNSALAQANKILLKMILNTPLAQANKILIADKM